MKKLFLLDAYALIFRAYYAFIKNPRITPPPVMTLKRTVTKSIRPAP